MGVAARVYTHTPSCQKLSKWGPTLCTFVCLFSWGNFSYFVCSMHSKSTWHLFAWLHSMGWDALPLFQHSWLLTTQRQQKPETGNTWSYALQRWQSMIQWRIRLECTMLQRWPYGRQWTFQTNLGTRLLQPFTLASQKEKVDNTKSYTQAYIAKPFPLSKSKSSSCTHGERNITTVLHISKGCSVLWTLE